MSVAVDAMEDDQRHVIAIPDDEEFMEIDNVGHQAQNGMQARSETDIKAECREAVLMIFPDICPDYLEQLAVQHAYDHEALISAILDLSEKGGPLPRRATLKRKRESADVGDRLCDLRKKYDNPGWREQKKNSTYSSLA